MIEFKSLDELDTEKPQRIILLYGSSGSGKTTLSAMFPDPLIIACDPGLLGGSLSAKRVNPKALHVRIQSYNDLLEVIKKLQNEPQENIKTIVIDSLTYMQRYVLNNILDLVKREIPKFEEWNLLQTRTRRIISAISSLPYHIIFTAVEAINKDEMTGQIFGGPDLIGQLARELPQACDVVLHLQAQSSYTPRGKEVVYKAHSCQDGIWMAKDRTGLLPPDLVVGYNPQREDWRKLVEPILNILT